MPLDLDAVPTMLDSIELDDGPTAALAQVLSVAAAAGRQIEADELPSDELAERLRKILDKLLAKLRAIAEAWKDEYALSFTFTVGAPAALSVSVTLAPTTSS